MSAPRTAALVVTVSVMLGPAAHAQRFFPDDPLAAEPEPFPTIGPEPRDMSEILELFSNAFESPGEHHPETGVIPAQGVNTLGEVLDGPWYATGTVAPE